MPGFDWDVQAIADGAPREVKYTAASSIERPTIRRTRFLVLAAKALLASPALRRRTRGVTRCEKTPPKVPTALLTNE